MSWLKLDDHYFDHPKIAAAGRDGALLDLAGMLYCARFLTDGRIPTGMVRRLAPVDDPASCAEILVSVGRWEPIEGGYMVHDYLKYNPSRAKVMQDRADDLARKRGDHKGRLLSEDFPDPAATADHPDDGASGGTGDRAAILDICRSVPRHPITGKAEWHRVYDAKPEEEHGRIFVAEAFDGLARIGVEERTALDLASTRPTACLDWLDNPDRYKNAKNPAGLLVKRLRALPEEEH